jgi:hypothetical protein
LVFCPRQNGIELKQEKIKFSYFSNVYMIEMNTREQELAYLIVKKMVTWYHLGRVKVGEGQILIYNSKKE